jgi:dihydropteroate synthase
VGVQLAGILNVTPDSFSDGGRWVDVRAAVAQGLLMHQQGATWIDVGGESTRPGAARIGTQQELDRVIPVVQGLVAAGCRVSIDTQKAAVADAALSAGAEVVNDVNGLRAEGMVQVVARHGAGAVVMHMRGDPRTMQRDTRYDELVGDVQQFLSERIAVLRGAGIQRIWADPGIGFGKSAAGCAELIRRLPELRSLGVPLYVGASRKSFLGSLVGEPDPDKRLAASLGAAAAAAVHGAQVLRVHRVLEHRQMLDVLGACT